MTRPQYPWFLLAFPTFLVISWPNLLGWVGGFASLLTIGALLLAGYTQRDRIHELEDDLAAERTVRRKTEQAFAEFQQAVSDAGGRVVLPLRPARQNPVPDASKSGGMVTSYSPPDLHIVEPPTADAPEADESWLDESPLFHDGDGRWA